MKKPYAMVLLAKIKQSHTNKDMHAADCNSVSLVILYLRVIVVIVTGDLFWAKKCPILLWFWVNKFLLHTIYRIFTLQIFLYIEIYIRYINNYIHLKSTVLNKTSFIQNVSVSIVEICEPGYYYDVTKSTCSACQRGFYQPKAGQNFCIKCPQDTTTDTLASTVVAKCKSISRLFLCSF